MSKASGKTLYTYVNNNTSGTTLKWTGAAKPEELSYTASVSNLWKVKTEQTTFGLGLSNLVSQRTVFQSNKKSSYYDYWTEILNMIYNEHRYVMLSAPTEMPSFCWFHPAPSLPPKYPLLLIGTLFGLCLNQWLPNNCSYWSQINAHVSLSNLTHTILFV